MRLFLPFLTIVVALLAGPASADGVSDLHQGATLRARKPPDLDGARAAFERAAASSDPEASASGLYFLGEMDEDTMRFAEAVTHYDASIARLPSSRYAQRAATRSSSLKAHSEGDFAPLVRLETVRRDPALSSNPIALKALTDAADHFPPGPVRVEARLMAAEAYRGRVHRPDEQIALLWLVVRDPRADVIASREAAVEIVDAEIAKGDVDAAKRAQVELGGRLDAATTARVARLVRRRRADVLATTVLWISVVLFGIAVARGGVRRALDAALSVLPLSVVFTIFAGGAGGYLASSYELGNATPFLMIIPLMLLTILLARAWGAVGSTRVPARVLRAVLCSSTVFALALLVLERWTPQYLEGFGL